MKTINIFLKSMVWLVLFSGSSNGAIFMVSTQNEIVTALSEAAGNNQEDTITISAGTYTISTPLTYILPDTSLENYSLTIQGDAAASTLLDGGNAVQILNIDTQDIDDSNVHLTIKNLTFQNGQNAGMAAGLSLWTNTGRMTVSGCTIKNNISTGGGYGDGGGARLRSQSAGTIIVENSQFSDNQSYYGAGAWAISYGNGIILFKNCLFSNNTARHSFGGAYGACDRGSITFSHNIFESNHAHYSGGGAWGNLGSNSSSADAVLYFMNNIFSKNTTEIYHGGGAYAYAGYGSTFIINNTFIDNAATQKGGGVYVNVSVSWTVPAFIYNNIMIDNTAASGGGDLYIEDYYSDIRKAGSPVSFYNNLYGDFSILNGNFLSQESNILNQNPLLSADFHLLETSPCIDTGTELVPDPPGLPPMDLDGKTRRVDGDSNGSVVVDIGADEYFVPDPADINGDGSIDLADVILSCGIVTGMPAAEAIGPVSDTNGDDVIGIEDAIFILQTQSK